MMKLRSKIKVKWLNTNVTVWEDNLAKDTNYIP